MDLRAFFPHVFFTLPVVIERPAPPTWDDGEDAWAEDEPDMTALEERDEYAPIKGLD